MASDFWDDQEAAQKILQELNQLKGKLENYDFLVRKYEDLETLLELCMETEDADLQQELVQDTKAFMKLLEKTKLETLLSGKHDAKNAILSLHAGAGGTEAQDWVSMLLRMYTRWAEDKGYKVTTLDILPGDEAGVKSVTILVEGLNAYGYLKAEKGVHRLVRISPLMPPAGAIPPLLLQMSCPRLTMTLKWKLSLRTLKSTPSVQEEQGAST